jgi:hypothetical protein
VSALAGKCAEPESAVTANIHVLERRLSASGRHASFSETAQVLTTLANYVEARQEMPDCKALLVALVSEVKDPSKRPVCFPYKTGRVCFAPAKGG